jgi:hypothetical protein
MGTTRVTGWKPGCACGRLDRARPIVLDPFNGSGTTGAAALELGCDYIGIDLNADYLVLARERIGAAARNGVLF